MDHGLLLCPFADASITIAYSDADWVGYKDICHSTTSYVIYIGPNLILWRFKK